MRNHYIIWAFGPDQSGIVAAITKLLFEAKCNLEDSSMMRLGSEFGIFMILSGPPKLLSNSLFGKIKKIEDQFKFNIGVKSITEKEAKFSTLTKKPFLITVLGPDRSGIVFQITSILAQFGFNISDLSTHRTDYKGKPGYIIFIEGKIKPGTFSIIEKKLNQMSRKLSIHANIKPIESTSL